MIKQLIVLLCLPLIVCGQFSGTITVPGTFSTLASALTAVNTGGLSGPLVILVNSGYSEVAPVGGFTISANSSSTTPLVIRGNNGALKPVLYAPGGGSKTPSSAIQDGIVRIIGSDYLEFSGFELVDLNTTSPQTMEFGIGIFKASANDGCNNVVIKNCAVRLNKNNNAPGNLPAVDGSRGIEIVNAFAQAHTTSISVNSASGAHSNNKIFSNYILGCNYGIVAVGLQTNSVTQNCDSGNEFGGLLATEGNTIVNFGGGGTNAAAGIRLIGQFDSRVANNLLISNNGNGNAHQGTLRGIYSAQADNTDIMIQGNKIALMSASGTGQLIAIDNQAGNNGIQNLVSVIANTIAGCTHKSAVSGNFYGIINSAAAFRLRVDSNLIDNNSTVASSGSNYLIYNNGAILSQASVSNNTLGLEFAGTLYSGNCATINNSNAGINSEFKFENNVFNQIRFVKQAATGNLIFISQSADMRKLIISQNTWKGQVLNHLGNQYGINNSGGISDSLIVSQNNITNYRRLLAGNFWFYYSNSNVPGTSVQHFLENTLLDFTICQPGTAAVVYIQSTDGGQLPYPEKNFISNRIDNINLESGQTFTGFLVSDLGNGGLPVGSQLRSNSISQVKAGGHCNGIVMGNPSNTLSGIAVSHNTLIGLSTSGYSANIIGINAGSAGAGMMVNNNKIGEIESATISGSVSGIFIGATGNYTIHHNIVGALSATTANGNSRVNGIYISTGSQVKVFYNTVFLSAQSSASVFGSNALYCSTSPSLELRNNILINQSVSSGSGQTVAFRRSAASNAAYGLSSNNNIFYAGVASSQNLLFYNNSAAYQTIAAMQAGLAPRESASFGQNCSFFSTSVFSPNWCHLPLGVSSVAESAALNIATFTLDIDNELRQGAPGYSGVGIAPDIGADEANFTGTTCTGVPAVTVSLSQYSMCAGQSFSLFPTFNNGTGGLIHQWEIAGSSLSFSSIPGAITAEASINLTTPGVYYLRLVNTCVANTSVGVSNIATVQVISQPSLSVVSNATVCAGSDFSLAPQGSVASWYNWVGPPAYSSTNSILNIQACSPYSAGVYTLYAGNGECTASPQTVQITVSSVTASLIANPPAMCVGGSATLSAVGNGLNYSWNNSVTGNSIIVTPTVSSSYSVFITGVNNCTMELSVDLTVNTPSILPVNATICLPANTTTIGVTSFTPSYICWYQPSDLTWPIQNGLYLPVSTTNNITYQANASVMVDREFSVPGSNGSGVQMQMFDILASTPLVINELELPVSSTGSFVLTVYARNTSFQNFSLTAQGWSIITSSLIAQQVNTNPTGKINLDFFIPAGQTAGFAVSVSGNSLLASGAGPLLTANSDMTVSSVFAGTNFSVTQLVSSFQGVLKYQQAVCTTSFVSVQVDVNAAPSISVQATSSSVCPLSVASATASGASSYTWSNGSLGPVSVMAPSVSTTYTIVGYSMGCSNQSTFNLGVFVPQLPVLSSNMPSVCPNQTVQLTASGLNSYTWSSGQNGTVAVVKPAAATIYTVYGHDTNNCFSSSTVSIGTKTVPSISILPIPGSFCEGDQIVLMANGAISYTWLPSATIGQTINVNTLGKPLIGVLGTALNSCTNTAVFVLQPDICNGLEKQSNDLIACYPVPASNWIQVTGIKGEFNYSIYNSGGTLICQSKGKENSVLPIGFLNTGFFLLYIDAGDFHAVKKILVIN